MAPSILETIQEGVEDEEEVKEVTIPLSKRTRVKKMIESDKVGMSNFVRFSGIMSKVKGQILLNVKVLIVERMQMEL